MTRYQSASYPFGWAQRVLFQWLSQAWEGRTTLPSVTLSLRAATLTTSSPQPYAVLNKVQEVGWETKGWLSVGLDHLLCHSCLGTQYPPPQPPAGPALPTLGLLSTSLNLADVQASGLLNLTLQSSVRFEVSC